MAYCERTDTYIQKLFSECNEKAIQKQSNTTIRAAVGKPEGTRLDCADIVEHIINTKEEKVYKAGLRILVLLLFGGNGSKVIKEELGVKIVGKLIREGFDKNFLS